MFGNWVIEDIISLVKMRSFVLVLIQYAGTLKKGKNRTKRQIKTERRGCKEMWSRVPLGLEWIYPSEPSEPCKHLDFRLLGSRIVCEIVNFYCISHSVSSIFLMAN